MTIRVLNTRPREQAAKLSRLLRDAGYAPVELPAVSFEAAWQRDDIATVLQRLRERAYAWLILPSANAGRYLIEGLVAQGFAAADLSGVPTLSGLATADALGLQPRIGLPTFSAAAALQALRPTLRAGQRVLMPHAEAGRDELSTGLEAAGVQVDAPVCYRTVPTRVEDVPEVDVVTLCSPSAVDALPLPAGTHVVCLGTTTAAAAQARGLHVAAVAEHTSMASLVEAVRVALANNEVPV
jgi:uroporphyrinogen III methyltransferase/synthase